MTFNFNINSITPVVSGGGTTINNEDITVTVNGEYTASTGYTGLGTVTVNVPTSGGGDAISTVKQEVNIPAPFTCSAAVADGWTLSAYYRTGHDNDDLIEYNSGYLYYAIGCVFDDTAPNILYIGGTNARTKAIKVPSGAVVTDAIEAAGGTANINGTNFKVDFTNASEKWVVFLRTSSAGQIPNGSINYVYNSGNIGTNYLDEASPYITYLNLNFYGKNYTESSPYSASVTSVDNLGILNTVCRKSYLLREYDVSKNIVFNWSNFSSLTSRLYITDVLLPCSQYILKSLKNFVTNNTNLTYGTTSLTTSSTNSFMGSVYDSIGRASVIPFILDASAKSSSSAVWYINSTDGFTTDTKNPTCPQEAFIIPPDMNIRWCAYVAPKTATQDTVSSIITTDSLKFFAEHSPNVTSRTLNIGASNINKINEADSSIMTSLTTKGWTVN